MNSSRLPGKMLMDVCGKPAIQHTWDRVRSFHPGDCRVVVLTDHQDIYDVCKEFGANVAMTPKDIPNGSARCQYALEKGYFGDGPIINVQGDSVLLNPDLLDMVCYRMTDPLCDKDAIHTLIRRITNEDDILSKDLAKVVMDRLQQYALWFSRSPIPYYRGLWGDSHIGENHHYYGHIGIYAWHPEALAKIEFWPGALYNLSKPQYEDLEMCEWLQQGLPVRCHTVHDTIKVYPELNTSDDHQEIEQLMESGDLPLMMTHD